MIRKMISRKTIGIILATAIACSLCGCDSKNSEKNTVKDNEDGFIYTEEKTSDYDYFKETVVRSNEVLLFNNFQDNLGIYNMDSKEWKEIYSSQANNLFTYAVKGQNIDDTFYTMGSTSFNKFSVVKYNKETHCAEPVIDVQESDSLIPIGYYNQSMYFIHNINDLGDSETRALAYVKDNEIVDFCNLDKALVSNGIIINDELYYTEYVEDEDVFELYDYSLVTDKSTKESKIYTDLIYRYKDTLLYVDENNNLMGLGGKKYYSIKTNANVDVLSDYGLAVQIYIDKSNAISVDIIDIESGKIIKTEEKFDGYIIDNSKLNIYCEGKIDVMELE